MGSKMKPVCKWKFPFRYEEPTWTGYQLGNPQVYMGWATPEEHNVIQTAVNVYERVVSLNINGSLELKEL